MKKLLVYLPLAVVLTACVTNARPPVRADAPAPAEADAPEQADAPAPAEGPDPAQVEAAKAQAIAYCQAETKAAYKAKADAAQAKASAKPKPGEKTVSDHMEDLHRGSGVTPQSTDLEKGALLATMGVLIVGDLWAKSKEKAKRKAEEEEREKKIQPQIDKLCEAAWQAVLREHKII